MFQTKLQQNEIFSSPSKVFLLGEYAVLTGLPALVATLSPRFTQSVVNEPLKVPARQSPAGRLHSWIKEEHGMNPLFLDGSDPFHGAGGFGASTAEFAMTYLAYALRNDFLKRDWKNIWRLYRKLHSEEKIRPSGADLVAQLLGGIVFFDPSDEYCLDVSPIFDWSTVMVFSATHQVGRKVPTHRHLEKLDHIGFPNRDMLNELSKILSYGYEGVHANNPQELGRAFVEYADLLNYYQLEHPVTSDDRKALLDIPYVIGVKGSGAMQSDAVIVLLKPGILDRSEVFEVAKRRDLRIITDGLTCEIGIRCQN